LQDFVVVPDNFVGFWTVKAAHLGGAPSSRNSESTQLFSKGMNPIPKNIKLYLLLFSDPYPA
jgi:hypothetical protein